MSTRIAGISQAVAAARTAQEPKAEVSQRGGKKIIKILDSVSIQGEILRPQMAISMQRSQINFDALKPKKSFLDRIIRGTATVDALKSEPKE